MQPYLFPYLGYFQLLSAVDEFWLLDDVQFIRRGWMNRNRILVSGREHPFTVPVISGSRDRLVRDVNFHADAVPALERLTRTMRHAYAATPGRTEAIEMLESVISFANEHSSHLDFTTLTRYALLEFSIRLGVDTPVRRSSELSMPTDIRGQQRIIAVCVGADGSHYLNMEGGRALYSPEQFADNGIFLQFLSPVLRPYPQSSGAFVAGLSILDLVATVDRDRLNEMIREGQISDAVR